jgi:hypothetical protein
MNSQLLRQVDRQTWIALVCVVVGWFFLATVVTTVGPVKRKYHFFDMLTVMLNPAWLLYGMGSSHPLESVAFGLGTGNAVARHISVGLGAYLALLACGFLAVHGLRAFRAAAPALTPNPS